MLAAVPVAINSVRLQQSGAAGMCIRHIRLYFCGKAARGRWKLVGAMSINHGGIATAGKYNITSRPNGSPKGIETNGNLHEIYNIAQFERQLVQFTSLVIF